ncbi:MAG: hypothetical protein GKR90_06110 [Pseudomonadales bacterium]|nr:hypothetical protein [Pseudomonadales bacterium]
MSGTIVIPVYKDDSALEKLLRELRLQAWQSTVVVVDGAGSASTKAIVELSAATYLVASPGRGRQIQTALENVTEGMCMVLHADAFISEQMRSSWNDLVQGEACWGRFDVKIPGLTVIAAMMNYRSRLTKICTGDQAMFFHTALLREAGGFSGLSLMEDIATSKGLKTHAPEKYRPLRIKVGASPRRWRMQGVLRTIVSMWTYRLRFYFGADAEELYRSYYSRKIT